MVQMSDSSLSFRTIRFELLLGYPCDLDRRKSWNDSNYSENLWQENELFTKGSDRIWVNWLHWTIYDSSIVIIQLSCGCWGAEHQFDEMDSRCEESFHCEHSGGCINQSQVCDFHTDCPFGEDEGATCGEDLFLLSKITGLRISFENDFNSVRSAAPGRFGERQRKKYMCVILSFSVTVGGELFVAGTQYIAAVLK